MAIMPPLPPLQRPTAVHERPCRLCPAAHYPPDPESEDILGYVKSGEMSADEATYCCAWNPSKRCKGAADRYGYKEATDAQ